MPSEPNEDVTLVAAYANNRVIGVDGGMPWHISEDFAHFKRVTMDGVLVMGRSTYDSIGRPLPGRRTVVITRDAAWCAQGHEDDVLVAHSVPEALSLARQLPGGLFVAGGAQIYAQTLALATHQILTEVDLEVAGDAVYPEFDRCQWQVTARVDGPGCTWVWWERIGTDPSHTRAP